MRLEQKLCFAAIAFAVLLSSCDLSNPSLSEARTVFEKPHEKEIKDGIKRISKFTKVDGQSAEMFGVKLYAFKYEAEIEYPKGANPECKNPVGFQPSCISNKYREPGEKEKFSGEIKFEKTENGWQPTRGL